MTPSPRRPRPSGTRSSWSRRPVTMSGPSCSWPASCIGRRRHRRSARSSNGRLSAPAMWPRSWPTRAGGTTRSCSSSSTPTRSTSTARLTANKTLNRTPLYARHVALGGRMVDFGGWDMPQQYTSIRDEHFAVRKAAGLFDVSHMGRLSFAGEADSLDFLQGLVTNDLSKLGEGEAQYNLLCNDVGGIIDDLVVYRGREGFFVVVNASNR